MPFGVLKLAPITVIPAPIVRVSRSAMNALRGIETMSGAGCAAGTVGGRSAMNVLRGIETRDQPAGAGCGAVLVEVL